MHIVWKNRQSNTSSRYLGMVYANHSTSVCMSLNLKEIYIVGKKKKEKGKRKMEKKKRRKERKEEKREKQKKKKKRKRGGKREEDKKNTLNGHTSR